MVDVLDNLRVGWILGDDDLMSFYQKLLESHSDKLDPGRVERLADRILDYVGVDDDIPF